MKKALFVAALCSIVVGPLSADIPGVPEVKMHITALNGNYRQGSGGEFAAEILDMTDWVTVLGFNPLNLYADAAKLPDTIANNFMTFCVETNEYISDGSTHWVTFDDHAIAGGTGGGPNDKLSQGAAFLYREFATASLGPTVYNYTPGAARAAAAENLQIAIWTLENEKLGPTVLDGTQMTAAIKDLLALEFTTGAWNDGTLAADLGVWRANNSGKYNVAVMNLNSTLAQSQLILVPLPGTILLGFLGLGYAGTKLRRSV
jgi:hypothetical protein